MNIKNIFNIELNFYIKNLMKYCNQKEYKEIDQTKNYIYFLDAPAYGNIGDQAIALGMQKFMRKYYTDYDQIEFQEKYVISYLKWLKNNIKNTDIICLTGGEYGGLISKIRSDKKNYY